VSADDAVIDAALLGRLMAAQFPVWAALPIEPVNSAGTDNALFRLGEAMVARLPRLPRAAPQVEKEQRWLPRLAPHLPLAVPAPLALGAPGEGYPWAWSVCRWIDGAEAAPERIGDPTAAAVALAGFIVALQGLDAAEGPPVGAQNNYRGVDLIHLDAVARGAIAALGGVVDTKAATAAWDEALAAPAWGGRPVWLHGDLHAGNLLARDGALIAVIDFGLAGVGDPACDLMAAWSWLPEAARGAFRAALAADPATWARGRGWAVYWGLVAFAGHRLGNPALAAMARRTLEAALADHRRGI
jgi:aminoglycoside phosphotransferase (APT) family kinase protein